MGRPLIALIGALSLVGAMAAYVLYASWQQPLKLQPEGAVLTIRPGESLYQVLRGLASQGWITRARWVGVIAQGFGLDKQIKAGEFFIESQMTVSELLMGSPRVRCCNTA